MTERYLTDREMAESFGVSKATIWRRAADGTLPKPVKLGFASRWIESEVIEAGERLKALRDGEAA